MDEDPLERSAIAVVRRFAAAWGRLDFAAIEALLDPSVRYANGPLDPIAGRPAVAAYLRGAGPFEACRWRLLSIAASGATVLTERIDELVVAGRRVRLPVMGAFEVADGRIAEWRDYFDLAAYRAQWPVAA